MPRAYQVPEVLDTPALPALVRFLERLQSTAERATLGVRGRGKSDARSF